MTKAWKRRIALLLCLLLCLSLFPAAAFAEDGDAEPTEEIQEEGLSVCPVDGDLPEEAAELTNEETSDQEDGSEAETDGTALTELTEDGCEEPDKIDDVASTPENNENDADNPVEESIDDSENEIEDIVIEEEDELNRTSNIIASGQCGPDLYWNLDEDGVLTVWGVGRMGAWGGYDGWSKSPWWNYRDSIISLYMEGGTTICDHAFEECSNLQNVTILSPITSIGQSAFRFCAMKEIYIPETVTSIGYEAFYKCIELKHVTLPKELKTLGFGAFYCCESLESLAIPGSVKQIESAICYDCSALQSVIISEGVTEFISGSAFSYCNSLTNVTIPSSMKNIGQEAFSYCSALQHVTIPDSVEEIRSSAFQGCTGLADVVIPASVKTIGKSAFQGCTGLTDLTLSNGLTVINDSAFSGCSVLKSVVIPETLTEIGAEAFYGCKSLTNADIQGNVASIGREAFRGCSSLETMNLPASLMKMGTYAFYQCKNLKAVTIPGSLSTIPSGAFYSCTGLTDLTLQNGLLAIDDYAFKDCSSLTDVMIPEGVASIGSGAFANCRAMTSITIPEGVTSIGAEAFSGCSALVSASIPGSVTRIGGKAFYECSALSELTIQEGVGEIGKYAFGYCSSLKSVTIPGTVKTIRECAFYYCNSLENLIIRDGTSIESGAFNCRKLREIRFLGAPPTMSGGVFTLVTADAYYPEGKGWTTDHLKNYGGKLTWKVFDPKEYDPSAYSFQTTLNMADFTGIFVYIDLPEGVDASQYTVEVQGESYRRSYAKAPVAVSSLPKGSGTRANMYQFEALRAGSPEMTDEVTVILKRGNQVIKSESYSVYSVAQGMLAGSLTADQENLVKGLLQYGYYGHTVFKNPLEFNPVIDGAPAPVAIPSTYAAKGDPTNFGAYVTRFTEKLNLDSAIGMNLYLTLASGYSMNDFSYRVLDKDGNAYNSFSVEDKGNQQVSVSINGIKSPQMARNFKLVVTLKSDPTKMATWTRSVWTCAYEGSARTSGTGLSFLQALYQYGLYAQKQFPKVA